MSPVNPLRQILIGLNDLITSAENVETLLIARNKPEEADTLCGEAHHTLAANVANLIKNE